VQYICAALERANGHCGGYENFVSKIGTGEHENRPACMERVGFSDLKIELMGATVLHLRRGAV
jgi:uncharacterized membrane protein YqhA